MGLAVGWSAVILGYGRKGLRKSLPHSLGELHDYIMTHDDKDQISHRYR